MTSPTPDQLLIVIGVSFGVVIAILLALFSNQTKSRQFDIWISFSRLKDIGMLVKLCNFPHDYFISELAATSAMLSGSLPENAMESMLKGLH